eukprot:CAMPEP_0179272868 /NCGR_PEP_ID=MMETSP0797-20121207/32721_1 /TAXON_ID=47934 /ORGANISM="Dinophysis acuminata, Strain DAEP01" /LENGTH=305 /DNA_ID=CAMNT_0020981281 /DNA_START=70 /DNA_END=984 /DNA_ORIENTATION=-
MAVSQSGVEVGAVPAPLVGVAALLAARGPASPSPGTLAVALLVRAPEAGVRGAGVAADDVRDVVAVAVGVLEGLVGRHLGEFQAGPAPVGDLRLVPVPAAVDAHVLGPRDLVVRRLVHEGLDPFQVGDLEVVRAQVHDVLPPRVRPAGVACDDLGVDPAVDPLGEHVGVGVLAAPLARVHVLDVVEDADHRVDHAEHLRLRVLGPEPLAHVGRVCLFLTFRAALFMYAMAFTPSWMALLFGFRSSPAVLPEAAGVPGPGQVLLALHHHGPVVEVREVGAEAEVRDDPGAHIQVTPDVCADGVAGD